jgi:hypothetical protein
MMSCYICLDSPAEKAPLLRSNCGCSVGWFHEKCHDQWIRAQDSMHPRCGMCRQRFTMKTNYCFSYWAGSEQQTLWHSYMILCLEFVQASLTKNQYAFFIPGESLFILLVPFFAYPISTYDFYCAHIIWKSIAFQLIEFTVIPIQASQLKIGLAVIHGLVFYLVHLIQCQRDWGAENKGFDLLFPYAISREIEYIDIKNKESL